MSILIRNAKVIDPSSEYHLQTLDILIEDGIVKEIATNIIAPQAQVVDAPDMHLSMGFVDLFADYREPGFEHKETIISGLNGAAEGGFTTVMVLPNTQPTISSKSIVQYLKKTAEDHAVGLLPIGAISANVEGKNIAEMLDMHANGAVAFSDGWKPIQNAGLMLKALEYVKAFDGTLIQIPFEDNLSAGGLMHEGINSTQQGMPGIPTISETLMLHRDIELLRYTQSKLHVTGISSAESVAMIRRAKQEGLSISCSVTPYHLVLNDSVLAGYDSVYKVMPPIRTEQDRLALIEGLKDGTIDCIASHHRPHEWDAKAKEFEYAADGMNIQELSFAIVFNALQNDIPLDALVTKFAQNANAIFGLGKQSLAINATADFALFSIKAKTLKNKLKSKSNNNPFIGKPLQGKVLGIVHKNTIVQCN
ncbi:MAG: dihydroorotase [Chitinophagaceae bacterium]|nr:dihydroorotase [Chitinophagaceae bacterium]